MNYNAHIDLAYLSQTHVLGGFLGDFVKGSQLSSWPKPIEVGIKLHRKIDIFTDSAEIITNTKQSFPAAQRRMAGVVLDVYFDHLLYKHQNKLPQTSLVEAQKIFYQSLKECEWHVSPRFQQVRSILLQYHWLQDYRDEETVLRALLAIEQRFKRKVEFAEASFTHIQNHRLQIEKVFLSFYPKLVTYTQETAKALTAESTEDGRT